MIRTMTSKSGGLSDRLRNEAIKPQPRYPAGKAIIERMFDACGDDAAEVKKTLLSGAMSAERMRRFLREEGIEVIASSAMIRRWIVETREQA